MTEQAVERVQQAEMSTQIVTSLSSEHGVVVHNEPEQQERQAVPLDELLRLFDQGAETWSATTERIGNEIRMLQAASPTLSTKRQHLAEQLETLVEEVKTNALREELGLARVYTETTKKQAQAQERYERVTQALDALQTRLTHTLPRALNSTMSRDLVQADREAGKAVEKFREEFLATFGSDQQEYSTPSQVSKAWLEVVRRYDRLASLRGRLSGQGHLPHPVAERLIRLADIDAQRRQGGKTEETLETLAMWSERM